MSLLEQQGERDVAVIAKAAGIGNPKRIYVMRKQLQGRQPNAFYLCWDVSWRSKRCSSEVPLQAMPFEMDCWAEAINPSPTHPRCSDGAGHHSWRSCPDIDLVAPKRKTHNPMQQ